MWVVCVWLRVVRRGRLRAEMRATMTDANVTSLHPLPSRGRDIMGLNAVDAYGFLAKAHSGHQVEGDVAVAGRAAEVDGRLSTQAGVGADVDRRIVIATRRGRANAAMRLADEQRRPVLSWLANAPDKTMY